MLTVSTGGLNSGPQEKKFQEEVARTVCFLVASLLLLVEWRGGALRLKRSRTSIFLNNHATTADKDTGTVAHRKTVDYQVFFYNG